MKLTINNIYKIKNNTNSNLVKRACEYAINEWCFEIDDEENEEIFSSVLCQGCIPNCLIYDDDIVALYDECKEEINEIMSERLMELNNCSLDRLFRNDWDFDDPLVLHSKNKCILGKYCFNEALIEIVSHFEEVQL
ncbi:MAG: hypothetical protein J6K52_07665 [Clostridia bacterium]|nr:hypothetical protein [Clostridia bacterium]